MALENRIDFLRKKHSHLDKLLRAEEAHPGVDDLVIHRLKSQKLALKDEIEQLLHGTQVAA